MARAGSRKRREWRSEARSNPRLSPVLARLGAKVRELRTHQGYTQEELARRAQLDAKHLQTIEVGKSNATVSTLIALANALGCSLSDLFHRV
jgi:transcriptional regulator with XRE-family HTH domain